MRIAEYFDVLSHEIMSLKSLNSRKNPKSFYLSIYERIDLMADIVFVFPPAPDGTTFGYHLGAGYVRSYLQRHHIDSDQFVTHQERIFPDIVAGILEYNPRIVGFTCYDLNYPYVRLLSIALKKKNPLINVILGGPTATFSFREIMNHTPEIDICVRGEGEQTMLELLQKDFTDLESIRGIAFRSGNEIVSTPERPLISGEKKMAELDVIPSPYLTGIIPPDGTTGILTSRGCVYNCVYCNFATMFHHTVRYHSIERVVAELHMIADQWNPAETKKVVICDDAFSLNLKRAKQLCQKIIDEKITLPLSVETRADHCDKELIGLMRDAGVKMIGFGLESASLEVLRTIKKSPKKEKQFLNQIRKCVTWAKEMGINTTVSVIFGLPKEGFKEAEKTLNFVKELNLDEYAHNILQIYAGTELFCTRKEYGLDVVHSPYFLPYSTKYAYNVWKVTQLPNSSMRDKIQRAKYIYCSVLSYKPKDDHYGCLLVKKMPNDVKIFCEWLQSISSVPLTCFDVTEGISKEKGINHLTMLLDGGVPVGPYFVVTKNPLRILRLAAKLDVHIPVPEVPFHLYGKTNALVTLDRLEDIEVLIKFVKNHEKDDILSFSSEDVPKTLVDACRWGESLCSASSGMLVLDGDNILTCYNGVSIGKIGDTKEMLQKNLETLLHKMEKERGCENCPVKKACSHCLVPYPLTDATYCEVRKTYPSVAKLITVMEWLHRFSRTDGKVAYRINKTARPLFYQGRCQKEDGPFLAIKDTVNLISFGGAAFAFTIEEFKSFSLGSTLAVILEAFQMGVSKESLVSYLCESAKVDTEEALNAISDAIILLRKKGFLENTD